MVMMETGSEAWQQPWSLEKFQDVCSFLKQNKQKKSNNQSVIELVDNPQFYKDLKPWSM